MSEIISSIYDVIAETGLKEGILFLDEVNCVSETLTPSMLQFLQFKMFGRHKVPEDWIIITAGNPVEYNRNAKEFDIVTWDRLKRIDIEPDFDAWKEYAYTTELHASVITYLEARKGNFYKAESTVDGKRFVTPRSWADLSRIIRVYEYLGIEVDLKLVEQYLQDKDIAEDFISYYDLYSKYKADYRIQEILNGTEGSDIDHRAASAPFDERLSLLGLLLDNTMADIAAVIQKEDELKELVKLLREVKQGTPIQEVTEHEEALLKRYLRMGVLSHEARLKYERVISFLNKHSETNRFEEIKTDYDALLSETRESAASAKAKLDHLFDFLETVWGDSQEMVILVTELTVSAYASRFIARYGSEKYQKYSESLKLYERKLEINRKGDLLWQNSTL